MAALPRYRDDWQDWLITNQFYGLIGLILTVLALAGVNIYMAHELKQKPPGWVLVYDSKGMPLARVAPVTGTADIPDRVTRYFLRQFVTNAFTIDSTFDAEKDVSLPRTYLMMGKGSQASKALTDFYQAGKGENNPITQCAKGWQEAQVQPVMAIAGAPATYEAHFTTIRHSYSDQGTESHNWRIIMHVIVGDQPVEGNDLGLYVDTLDLKEQP